MVSAGNRTRLSLRIPEKIDVALKREAEKHCRSQNSLICEILQAYVEEHDLCCSDSNLTD